MTTKNVLNRKITYIGFGIDSTPDMDGAPILEGYLTVVGANGVSRNIDLADLDHPTVMDLLYEGLTTTMDMYNFCKDKPELFRQHSK